MDALSWIAAMASCVTAIATAVTVIVAMRQFKHSLAENQKQIEIERLNAIKDEALYVDAWIVLPKEGTGKHKIVLKNETNGCLRDIEVKIKWKGYSETCYSTEPLRIRTLPPGYWIVSKNYDPSCSKVWEYPEAITKVDLDSRYVPRFSKDENHVLEEISFKDMHGLKWLLDFRTRELIEK